MKRKIRLRIPAVRKDTNRDSVKEEVKSRVTEMKQNKRSMLTNIGRPKTGRSRKETR